MKGWTLGLGIVALLLSGNVRAQDGPVGYVLKVKPPTESKEPTSVLLRRGKNAQKTKTDAADVWITPETLRKRVFVYVGDFFKLSGEVTVWFLSGNQTLRATNGEAIVYYPRQQGSKTRRGGRPQQDPEKPVPLLPGKPQFLFGEKHERTLYLPVAGPLGVVWYNPPGYRAQSLQVMQGSRTLFSETIAAAAVHPKRPIGTHRSEKFAEALRSAQAEDRAEVVLQITFALEEPPKTFRLTQKFSILPLAAAQALNTAWRQWKEASPTLAFERLDAYWMELEQRGCGMECVVHLVDWWAEDTENYAANAALHALALRAECKPLERLLLPQIKE